MPDTQTPRVLMINGSGRASGHTAGLLEQVATLLQANGIQVETLDLYGQDLVACVGCEACISHTSICPRDDSRALLAHMASYDGLVLASPVYVGSVTAQLKLLIDKSAWWVHRPPMVGKPGLAIATTAGSKLGSVLRYLDYVLVEWGMQPAGRIGRTISQDPTVHLREVARFVALLRQERSTYRPRLREVISFEVKRVLTRFQQIDRDYWDATGWQTRSFYYDCHLGPFNRVVGLALRALLARVIKPARQR